ncbi:hypothetical protein [Aquimarina algicola]|uniref:Uncharacterized protein n=1 Tax=Aquimarina algicola TaxID=2589995 RepID=A0A504JDV6_9FLAO|nr:hypothetical protein [Aquimarina algicola]TPN85783.1 hypothetical protein FHK87_10865 [Aquimarina algicola]
MGYSQITDLEKIKAIMVSIGKETVIQSFEKNIGLHWSDAKMNNFYICGLKKTAVLYYLDGKYPFGSLVLEFEKEFITAIQ